MHRFVTGIEIFLKNLLHYKIAMRVTNDKLTR